MADAILALQSAAPPSARGTAGPTGIGSDIWHLAGTAMHDACEAAGFTVAIEGFVGG